MDIPKQPTIPPMPKTISHEEQVKEHCKALMDLFGAKFCTLYGDNNERAEELNYYLLLGGCKVHADGQKEISITDQGFSLCGEDGENIY